jgi:tRNA U34 5-methylaminomethyl-2-thiouridine-forming methyltransferase MnmC
VKRNIITTADGSKTIQIEEWNEQYHSVHGAIQEAKHVFIKEGLYHYCSANSADSNVVSILEIGFGTGLNAFITLLEADKLKTKIHYFGVEAFPVGIEEMNQLNYVEQLHAKNQDHLLKLMHESSWEVEQNISSFFTLTKQKKIFSDIKDINSYDIIYFDAFGSRVQPELWTETILKRCMMP